MSAEVLVAALVELITVHMVDGRVVEINPTQIVQLVHPNEAGPKLLVDTVKCVVRLADGSYVAVAETCEEVQAKIGSGI